MTEPDNKKAQALSATTHPCGAAGEARISGKMLGPPALRTFELGMSFGEEERKCFDYGT
jgi:hypothetical protein